MFQVSGIKKVVHNVVECRDGEKVKVEPTTVWELAHTAKGDRWLKYEMGTLAELRKKNLPDAEFAAEAKRLIKSGCSPAEMNHSIRDAMRHRAMNVWFSGDTCNVEKNVTIYQNIEATVIEKDVKRIVSRMFNEIEQLRSRSR